jgi:hypothetical protein
MLPIGFKENSSLKSFLYCAISREIAAYAWRFRFSCASNDIRLRFSFCAEVISASIEMYLSLPLVCATVAGTKDVAVNSVRLFVGAMWASSFVVEDRREAFTVVGDDGGLTTVQTEWSLGRVGTASTHSLSAVTRFSVKDVITRGLPCEEEVIEYQTLYELDVRNICKCDIHQYRKGPTDQMGGALVYIYVAEGTHSVQAQLAKEADHTLVGSVTSV